MKGYACGSKPHDQAPATITCTSVVSNETVRVGLMIATLNDLEVKFSGILNTYIQVSVAEKV